MHRKHFFLIDCSQAANCCDKAQYKEANRLERLKMTIHLLFCRKCREYTSRNTKLTKLIRKAGIKTCTAQERKVWKEEIEAELTDTHN